MRTLGVWLLLGAVLAVMAAPVGAADRRDGATRARESARFDFDELDGVLTLQFLDAVTGQPLADAAVTLREVTRRTDGSGMVSFPFPTQDSEEGVEYALVEKPGYVTSRAVIHVIFDSVYLNRYSISPSLPAGRLRVTLDWGREPRDLDAHLVKRGRYHISYRDTRKFEDQAWLDRDDMDGEGPETITVRALDPEGEYAFYVHDFSHRDQAGFRDFGKSRARVQVFTEAGLVQSFEVPRGAGRVWRVFTIRRGSLEPASAIVDRID